MKNISHSQSDSENADKNFDFDNIDHEGGRPSNAASSGQGQNQKPGIKRSMTVRGQIKGAKKDWYIVVYCSFFYYIVVAVMALVFFRLWSGENTTKPFSKIAGTEQNTLEFKLKFNALKENWEKPFLTELINYDPVEEARKAAAEAAAADAAANGESEEGEAPEDPAEPAEPTEPVEIIRNCPEGFVQLLRKQWPGLRQMCSKVTTSVINKRKAEIRSYENEIAALEQKKEAHAAAVLAAQENEEEPPETPDWEAETPEAPLSNFAYYNEFYDDGPCSRVRSRQNIAAVDQVAQKVPGGDSLVCARQSDTDYLSHLRPDSAGECPEGFLVCAPSSATNRERENSVCVTEYSNCPINDVNIVNRVMVNEYAGEIKEKSEKEAFVGHTQFVPLVLNADTTQSNRDIFIEVIRSGTQALTPYQEIFIQADNQTPLYPAENPYPEIENPYNQIFTELDAKATYILTDKQIQEWNGVYDILKELPQFDDVATVEPILNKVYSRGYYDFNHVCDQDPDENRRSLFLYEMNEFITKILVEELGEDEESPYWNGQLDSLTIYSLYYLVFLAGVSLCLSLWNLLIMRQEYHKSYEQYNQRQFYDIIKCAKDITQALQVLNLSSILFCAVLGYFEVFKILTTQSILQKIQEKSKICLPPAFDMTDAIEPYVVHINDISSMFIISMVVMTVVALFSAFLAIRLLQISFGKRPDKKKGPGQGIQQNDFNENDDDKTDSIQTDTDAEQDPSPAQNQNQRQSIKNDQRESVSATPQGFSNMNRSNTQTNYRETEMSSMPLNPQNQDDFVTPQKIQKSPPQQQTGFEFQQQEQRNQDPSGFINYTNAMPSESDNLEVESHDAEDKNTAAVTGAMAKQDAIQQLGNYHSKKAISSRGSILTPPPNLTGSMAMRNNNTVRSPRRNSPGQSSPGRNTFNQ